ncbi:MAG: DNA primase [Balneolales bacterium]
MIPDDKKEEVRDAADIVDVVSDYVKLKRTGSGFAGLCPFHNEKTPSFHVTPGMSIYKCFGCGAGGDVFNFVMEMEGIGFTESIRTLAERYNIILPAENKPEYDPSHTDKEGIYHALRFAGIYFHRTLMEHEEAKTARDYLAKRGYTKETIRKFGLGYTLKSGDSLKGMAEKEALKEEYLHKAGLLKSDANGVRSYDTFRGRLMFPIFNPSKKVIAYGGRILKDSKKAPKYINSPQTEVYNKSEVLYGIHAAKNEIRKEKEAILVEGYTDVITMHQAGVRNVIATSGTALTSLQMRILSRYADTLLMIYDSDSAGQAAMTRGIDIALTEGLGIRLLQLPEGDDPDSFVKQFGKEGFLGYKKENSRDFLSFLIQGADQAGEWDDPVTKPKVVGRLLESIACIPDVMSRETFVQKLAKESKIGDRKLFERLDITMTKKKESDKRAKERAGRFESQHNQSEEAGTFNGKQQNQKARREPVAKKKMPPHEKEIVRLLLVHQENMVKYIGSLINEEQFENELLRNFFKDIMQRFESGQKNNVETYAAMEHPYPELLGEIVMERFSLSERGNEKRDKALGQDSDPYRTARGAIKLLQLHFLDNLVTKYSEEYEQAEGDDKIRLNKLIQKISLNRSKISVLTPNKAYPEAEAEIIKRKKELESKQQGLE